MPMEAGAGSRRAWPAVQWLTAAWALALAYLCLAMNHFWFYDDGFITLRYARHLVDGLGPQWNRTGVPVEGFSSPLHLVLVAALLNMGADPIMAVRGLSFAFHVVLVIFVWNFVRRSSGTEAGVLAAALIAASWPLLLWDLGGLETVPFCAVATVGVMVTLRYLESGARRDIELGGLLLGVAVFMRPDGAVFAAVALAACLTAGRRSIRRRIFDVLIGSALCGMMALPWELFRIRYYHAPLPNTYYAKIYGVPLGWRIHSGLVYWRVYLTKAPYFVLVLAVVVGLMVWKQRVKRFDMAVWACIAAYALYVLDCGGDHMLGFRFIAPVIPLMAVALVRGVAQLGWLRTPVRAAAVSAVLLFMTARQAGVSLQNPRVRDGAGMFAEEVGRYIDAHWKPGSVVALNVAGATPYFADNLNYIDMLGLNDAAIAQRHPVPVNGPWVDLVGHVKGDGASVLERRPEFIILGGPVGSLANYGGRRFLGDDELMRLPGFALQYKPCVVPLRLSDFAYQQLSHWVHDQMVTFTYYQRRDLREACTAPATP